VRALVFVAALCGAAVAACGARSGVELPSCESDSDCAEYGSLCRGVPHCIDKLCVRDPPLDCDDEDPCTADSCVEPGSSDASPSGCVHENVRVDMDRDRHDALAVAGPSCGDDCDDTNPAVFPGADEICNGRDDDCDERIDEGASYTPERNDVRVTTDPEQTGAGGLAWSPATETWGATYWAYRDGTADVWFVELDEHGRPLDAAKLLTPEPGDAFGASLVWTGREYDAVWEDRRAGNYEIFFNRLAPDGEKLGPDYRVTEAPGWSINSAVLWTGDELAIVWQDGRHEDEVPENFEIYLTFLDRDGFEIGDDLRLTNDPSNSEGPAIARGGDELGIAFVDGRLGTQQVFFLVTDLTGNVVMPEVRVSAGSSRAVDPVVTWVGDAFLVAWQDESGEDFDIMAARVSRDPPRVEPPIVLSGGPSFERAPRMLWNGDRTLVVYSDDRAGSYDIYGVLLDEALAPLGDPIRITTAPRDSVFGAPRRAGTALGILFDDQRDGNWEAYFTRLLCIDPGVVE